MRLGDRCIAGNSLCFWLSADEMVAIGSARVPLVRRSELLLERISRLRKEFEERRSAIHAVVNPLRDAPQWENVGPIASLGQLFKTYCPEKGDTVGDLPTFLTLGMRQLVDRTHQLLNRISAMDARVADQSGVTPRWLRMALDEILRNMASLPDSIEGQDSRGRGLRVLIELLERSAQALEAIQAKRTVVLTHWDELVQLLKELVAWSSDGENDHGPPPEQLTVIVQSLIRISQRPDWVDFLWMTDDSPREPVAVVAAEGWNVGLLMLCGARGLEELTQISPEELATAGILHDIGLLIHDNGIPNAVGVGYFEAHPRRGERLIQRWLPGAGPAREVALWHHERMNGMGYPDSISFADIPPLARLVGAAKWVAGYWGRGGENGAPLPLSVALDLGKGQVESGIIDKTSLAAISAAAGLNPRVAS